MHAMVGVWLLFSLLLFIAEPLSSGSLFLLDCELFVDLAKAARFQ
jgi:hypothetical protein